MRFPCPIKRLSSPRSFPPSVPVQQRMEPASDFTGISIQQMANQHHLRKSKIAFPGLIFGNKRPGIVQHQRQLELGISLLKALFSQKRSQRFFLNAVAISLHDNILSDFHKIPQIRGIIQHAAQNTPIDEKQ